MKLKDLLPFLAENQNEFKVHCAIGGQGRDAQLPLNEFLVGNLVITKTTKLKRTLVANIYFHYAI
ncbi:Uncharacterised protein [Campylobacter devanensis]|uniref:Uncharacterized protein n=1 Tax=Campylobacter devanensis TaxID=3161138 RepID=A0A1X9SRU1_9BACT|nr:hypothetical protein [Campylobacter lanienae]ARQ98957.1 hypothetical protein CIGN_0661 [Campylobacter lanienae]SUX02026.1 Uncharacterised protein [Campylobacter lanienae]